MSTSLYDPIYCRIVVVFNEIRQEILSVFYEKQLKSEKVCNVCSVQTIEMLEMEFLVLLDIFKLFKITVAVGFPCFLFVSLSALMTKQFSIKAIDHTQMAISQLCRGL